MMNLVLASTLIGCMSTTVEIHTRITEDGEVLRNTRYDKKERYIRQYAPGEDIPSDYVHTSDKTNETSHNTIRVAITDYFIYRHFTYNETFSDITNKDKAIESAMRIYDLWVSVLAYHIHKAIGKKYRRSEIKDAITHVYDPLVEELVFTFRKYGPQGLVKSEALKPIENRDSIIEHIAIRLRPVPYKSYKKFKASIRSAFDGMRDVEDSYFEIFLTDRDVLNIFGIDGDLICLSCDYKFKLSLAMPGNITRHNGQLLDDGRIQWKFKDEDFIYEPRILMARSILFYPFRVFIAILIIIIALAIVVSTWKLRRKVIL